MEADADTNSSTLDPDHLTRPQPHQFNPAALLLSDPSLLYVTRDGYVQGAWSATVNVAAILVFALVCGFAIYNMVRFYRHRNYSLGLFYIFTVFNLIFRLLYFVLQFLFEESYANVIFLCTPASMSCAIGLCQIMNYVVLYIRLDSYASHRTLKRGDEVPLKELEAAQRREKIASWILTALIVAYPVTITILLIVNRDLFTGQVILMWEKYEIFYMFNFILIAILLVTATFMSLSHMRKVFGNQSMQEEKSIKNMLLLFCGTYLVRVVFAILLHFKKEWVRHMFDHANTLFVLAVFILWAIWDVLPLAAMLWTHYKNFSSFQNEEILFTEYSVDDNNRGTFRNYSLHSGASTEEDLLRNNMLETSGVINLDSSDSESESDMGSSSTTLNESGSDLKKDRGQHSIIIKERSRPKKTRLLPVSQSLRESKKQESPLSRHVINKENGILSSSQEPAMAFGYSRPGSQVEGPLTMSRSNGRTSRTVSANMLKWSLARSINLGIFSKRVFTKEMVKASSRKSTIDQKQRLLITADSEEFKQMQMDASRRSRSFVDIQGDDDSEDAY